MMRGLADVVAAGRSSLRQRPPREPLMNPVEIPRITDRSSRADDNADVVDKLGALVHEMLTKDPTVRRFYVGIASGVDVRSALRRRWDKTKQDWGINEMIAIYRSEHQPICRQVESELETYFQSVNADIVSMDKPDLLNRTGGGGGRISGQPWHYVYVAVQRLGKKS